MTRQHHSFCDIEPTERGHGQFCVSRPIAEKPPPPASPA